MGAVHAPRGSTSWLLLMALLLRHTGGENVLGGGGGRQLTHLCAFQVMWWDTNPYVRKEYMLAK